MKTHVSVETILLVSIAVLALLLFSTVGLPMAKAFASSVTRSDSRSSRGEELEALIGSFRERKPWYTLAGQFSNVHECSDAALRHLLRATDAQWERIEPRFQALEAIRRRTRSTIGVFMVGQASVSGGASSGGNPASPTGRPPVRYEDARRRRPAASQRPAPRPSVEDQTRSGWLRPSQNRKNGPLTEGQRCCEALLDLIESGTASPEQIRAKMAHMAAYRRQAETEVKAAQEALRQVVTRRQEALLILMGHLD